MQLSIILFTTAFLMEAIGSYISIVGLSAFFNNDYVIMFMGVILDIAKIVAVSFLYQNWKDLGSIMKYYTSAAVLVLMLITSSGAFGYLSGAFLHALQPNKALQLQLTALSTEQSRLMTEKQKLLLAKEHLSTQVSSIASDNVKDKQKLIASFKSEQDYLLKNLSSVENSISTIGSQTLATKTALLKQDVHIGPITYVADMLKLTQEQASTYIILMIIFVFDPLAIMLILAGNYLLIKHKASIEVPTHVPETSIDIEPVINHVIINDVPKVDLTDSPVKPKRVVKPKIEKPLASKRPKTKTFVYKPTDAPI